MGDEEPKNEAPRRAPGEGGRLSSLETEAERADARLKRLEVASGQLRQSVDMLAEATGELRRQSAQMRAAALRVADVVEVAAKRRRQKRPAAKAKRQ